MKNLKVGLQLYSIRDAIAADMDAAFKAVKEMGYDYVEWAGATGGRTVQEVRELLDKHGLTCVSVHQPLAKFTADPVAAMEFVKVLGAAYRAIPISARRQDSYLEEWDATMDLYGRIIDDSDKNGITQLYHNHDFEFSYAVDGEQIYDRMFSALPDTLQPEFDTAWVHYAGYDPAEYIRKFAGRVEVVHLKDFACAAFGNTPVWQWVAENGRENKPASLTDAGFSYQPVGYGMQNWASILTACKDSGTEYVIVEQDSSPDRPSLESAAMSRAYLKENFGI